MAQKVLLIGNGINNASPGYRWEELIQRLIEYVDLAGKIDSNVKPFPMLYEEIVLRSNRKRHDENQIKKFIASEVQKIEPNEIHNAIARLGFKDILTTNYDYGLEKVFKTKINPYGNLGYVRENRYSVFRHSEVGKSRIWHIHGEAIVPSSIVLGYEHYCGYLQYMRNYIITGTSDSYKTTIETLMKRIIKQKRLGISWIDHFLTSDVFILGLKMDFVEMHLWWLLTYRAKAKKYRLLPIHNKIVFFVPRQYVEVDKAQFLSSCGVNVIPLKYQRTDRRTSTWKLFL